MNYIKTTILIFSILAVSRFVPHPPNFTSLLALSFYVPVMLGNKYIPALMISFIITDIIIGFHSVLLFTWGSVFLISLISKYFKKSILIRISGALGGALIFYIITNFGVWALGNYGYTFEGLIMCYTLAIPFFGYSLISTLIFSGLIEGITKIKSYNKFKYLNIT